MLIPLSDLVRKYNIQFKGILHVGAHECEELEDYEKYTSRDKILWVEAMKEKIDLCKRRYPHIQIEEAVVSDKVEKVTFHIANNGQSSSLLEFGLHSAFHPDVVYNRTMECETTLLKDLLRKYDIAYNFLNLDIQGVELKALKGMQEYLHTVDYIYTEVNSDYVYQQCALITEIDEYLKTFGLYRVETVWYGQCKWGDAFYIRKTFPKVSLCIPTYNRFDTFLSNHLKLYLENPYIDEVVISDETGEDSRKIASHFPNVAKLKVHVNETILGAFANKNRVVSLASNDWVCLMDSDNYAPPSYFEAWIDYIQSHQLSMKYIYAPSYTIPQPNHSGFDYTQYQGLQLDGSSIRHLDSVSVLLNTGNYIVHKENYLASNRFLTQYQTIDMDVQDVIFKALLLFLNHSIFAVVPKMAYAHIVHGDSLFLKHQGTFDQVYARIKQLYSDIHQYYDTVESTMTWQKWQRTIKPKNEWLYNCSEYTSQTDEWVPFPIGMGWSIISHSLPIQALQHGRHDRTVLCAISPSTDQRRRPTGVNRSSILHTLAARRIPNRVLESSVYFKELPNYKFVISPEGNGVDCHRHYEALMAGCIPIVEDHEKIREKYKGCPILYTQDYSEITEEYLNTKYNEMMHTVYDYSRLLLSTYPDTEKRQIRENGNYWSTRTTGKLWYPL